MMAEEINPFYTHMYGEEKPELEIKIEEDIKPRYLVGRGGAMKMSPEEYKQQSAAMGRGVAKGVLGGPGTMEKFITRDVPGFLGYETPKYAFGRETFLPTGEEVGARMKAIGLGETPEKYKTTEQAAEVVSGVLTPFPEAKFAKGAYETAAALSPKTAIRRLFGEEKTVSDVGKSIFSKLNDRLQSLVEARRPEAKQMFQKYFDAAKPHADEIRNTFTQTFDRYKSMFANDLSQEQIKLINDSLSRLKGDKGIGALEKERRRLFEISDGVYEGYGAIAKGTARQMAESLQGTIEKVLQTQTGSNPARVAFDFYRDVSKPINEFASRTGAKIETMAKDFLPDVPKVDEAKLPSSFFESERSIEDLKRLSGDAKFADQAARDHIASEFAKKRTKTADDVDAYIAQNKDWLKQVPDVLKDLETLKNRLGRAQTTKFVGKLGAVGGASLGGALGGLSLYDMLRGK